MTIRKDPVRIEVHMSRTTMRRGLVLGGTLVLLAVGARLGFAVPVTFSDGNVLTAKQLNDDFSDLEQRMAVVESTGDSPGTRLKGKFLRGADGTRQYQQGIWHDAQLGVDCISMHAADGKMRCLPTGSASTASVIRYQDAACTQALVSYAPPTPGLGCSLAPTPKYVLNYEEFSTACPSGDPLLDALPPVHVYPLGAPSGATATCLLKGVQCQGNSGLGTSTWQIGAEIPASTFVEATNATDP